MTGKKLLINSSQGNYEVLFSKHITEIVNILVSKEKLYHIIADEKVWQMYHSKFSQLGSYSLLLLKGNESTKTIHGVQKVLEWLSEDGANKYSELIAIGGGVIQDVVTTSAHIYMRGIRWHFIPTTLLSQSDSCIGAKSGLNLLNHKNQIGVFHSPQTVFVVEEFLKTIKKIDLESGYGEVLKLSVIGLENFYQVFKKYLLEKNSIPEDHLQWVYASLNSKKYVIEQDEYENSSRKILNYGHSFGHALETCTNNEISHGIGVLFGMDLVNYLGTHWGVTDPDFYKEFKNLIKIISSSRSLSKKITAEQLINELKKDKKSFNSKINFILVQKVGHLKVFEKSFDSNLNKLVSTYLENESIFCTT